MITILMMLAAQAPSAANLDPADWVCATPLIQKNYMQPHKPAVLARRIADECSKAFVSSEKYEGLIQLQRNVYLAKGMNFELEIGSKIESLRLRDQIKLKH